MTATITPTKRLADFIEKAKNNDKVTVYDLFGLETSPTPSEEELRRQGTNGRTKTQWNTRRKYLRSTLKDEIKLKQNINWLEEYKKTNPIKEKVVKEKKEKKSKKRKLEECEEDSLEVETEVKKAMGTDSSSMVPEDRSKFISSDTVNYMFNSSEQLKKLCNSRLASLRKAICKMYPELCLRGITRMTEMAAEYVYEHMEDIFRDLDGQHVEKFARLTPHGTINSCWPYEKGDVCWKEGDEPKFVYRPPIIEETNTEESREVDERELREQREREEKQLIDDANRISMEKKMSNTDAMKTLQEYDAMLLNETKLAKKAIIEREEKKDAATSAREHLEWRIKQANGRTLGDMVAESSRYKSSCSSFLPRPPVHPLQSVMTQLADENDSDSD
jgi:hypothetical protein